MPLLPVAESFRRLVEGSDTGAGATLTRAILAGLAAPYGLAVTCRNAAYDRRWLRIGGAGVPVVSVGNLTLGGTGKTPLVAWVARAVSAAGLRPAGSSLALVMRAGCFSPEPSGADWTPRKGCG
jgi:tetraacyldisaccharide 4'-kinase